MMGREWKLIREVGRNGRKGEQEDGNNKDKDEDEMKRKKRKRMTFFLSKA